MKVKYKTYLQIAGNRWIVICYTRHGTGLQRIFSTLYFEDKIKAYFQRCNAKASVTQHRTIASSPFGTFTSRKSFLLDRSQICWSFDNDGYFLAFNRRRNTRFKFLTFSSASYTNYASAQERKPSSYQILRQIKGRNAWLEMLGVLSFLSWIRLHAED